MNAHIQEVGQDRGARGTGEVPRLPPVRRHPRGALPRPPRALDARPDLHRLRPPQARYRLAVAARGARHHHPGRPASCHPGRPRRRGRRPEAGAASRSSPTLNRGGSARDLGSRHRARRGRRGRARVTHRVQEGKRRTWCSSSTASQNPPRITFPGTPWSHVPS